VTDVWGKRVALVHAYRTASTGQERREAMDDLIAIHSTMIAAERTEISG